MNFFKKLFKKPEPANEPKIKLAMIMLPDPGSFSYEKFIADIRSSQTISEVDGNNDVATFKFDGEQFYISHMPVAIPGEDIENTAQYAYNWETAVEDLKDHKAHLIVAISSTNNNALKHFRLITGVISSLLKTTDAIGVYDGEQSLLIPKKDYLIEAAAMDDSTLPLNIWIYLGLRNNPEGNSGYTYGLTAFGLHEIEVIDSTRSLTDIHELLYNVSHYILLSGAKLNAGETLGSSENEKIKIDFSKAVLVEGESYKLSY